MVTRYEEFQNICRICLLNGKLRPIDDEIIINIIYGISGINVKDDIDLPQKICETCYTKIHKINEFALECEENETTLKKCKNEYYERVEIKDEMVQIKQEPLDVEEEEEQDEEVEEEIVQPFENVIIKTEPNLESDTSKSLSKNLSKQSTVKYEKTYEGFIKWCNSNANGALNESNFVSYFECMSQKYKSSSLWVIYSMLRTTMCKKQNIDISKYEKLNEYMKKHSLNQEPKKSKNLSNNLSEKSSAKYEKTYDDFTKWCNSNANGTINEPNLISYFNYMSQKYKSSSLWVIYSMLRATICKKQNIDINKYEELNAFLKKHSDGYEPKKSKIFGKNDIEMFLRQADDFTYLLEKVALIIGVAGACSKEELPKLYLENVRDEGDLFRIRIPGRNKNTEFLVSAGDFPGLNMVEIIREYLRQRPPNPGHNRFFVGYKKGVCINLPVGRNTFAKMPKIIAAFLNLPHPEEYTGHCFRRSNLLLADKL